MENPKIKKGDIIIVTDGRNGAPEGIELEVINKSGSYWIARDPEKNMNYNIFSNGNPKDIFILADREARKKYLKEKIVEVKKDLLIMERDLEVLTKYDSEEEYMAYKISEILKNKDNKVALTSLLKELKKTNYL